MDGKILLQARSSDLLLVGVSLSGGVLFSGSSYTFRVT